MKSNPVRPGGSLKSKPMRPGAFGCLPASAFFGLVRSGVVATPETNRMDDPESNRAQRIAQAAMNFEQRLTGRRPSSVAVVISDDTLVITLRGTYSHGEMALGRSASGAARLRELHRQLFATASAPLRQEIQQISGVEMREASAEVDPSTGTVVQVYSLAGSVPADTWSGSDPG